MDGLSGRRYPVYEFADEDMTVTLWVSGILLFGAISIFCLTRLLQNIEQRAWW
jgi:hypothetical protein